MQTGGISSIGEWCVTELINSLVLPLSLFPIIPLLPSFPSQSALISVIFHFGRVAIPLMSLSAFSSSAAPPR